jgi:transcriptional regulator with XRE-family HTH domain
MLTPAQLRAARGLLKWTQVDLAEKSGVHVNSIKSFETGSDPKRSTLLALEITLRRAGVVLIDADATHGEGVMFRAPGGESS